MFIDIPKLFDKNFVTGYLLPSILFTLLTGWLVQLAYNFQLIDFQLNWVQQNTRNLMVVKIPDVPEATFILGLVILVCLTLPILLLSLNRMFPQLLKPIVDRMTVPKGIPAAEVREALEKRMAIPAKVKKICGKLNVSKERFWVRGKSLYLWAAKTSLNG